MCLESAYNTVYTIRECHTDVTEYKVYNDEGELRRRTERWRIYIHPCREWRLLRCGLYPLYTYIYIVSPIIEQDAVEGRSEQEPERVGSQGIEATQEEKTTEQ